MQKIKEYNIIFVCPLLNFYDGLPKLQEAEFVFIHLDGRSIYCSFDVYLLSCTVCFWLATKTVTFFTVIIFTSRVFTQRDRHEAFLFIYYFPWSFLAFSLFFAFDLLK